MLTTRWIACVVALVAPRSRAWTTVPTPQRLSVRGVVRGRRATLHRVTTYVDLFDDDDAAWEVGDATLTTLRDSVGVAPDTVWDHESVFLVAPALLVGAALLAATVVTVETEDATPPPSSRGEHGKKLPRLADWVGQSPQTRTAGSPFMPEGARGFEPEAIASPSGLFAATLFQWRVFSLETNYPTGFLARGGKEPAFVELLRAIVGFFVSGLGNARRYEARCREEVEAGADATPRRLPLDDNVAPPRLSDEDDSDDVTRKRVVRYCAEFVEDFGVSIAARDGSDGALLGVASLRVRRLPRRSGEEPYSPVAYVTGLAVARTARRRGVARALVDFCARKGRAWGADGIALHVNKLNQPALCFYEALGFDVVEDWMGYNPARFLLYADFLDSSSGETHHHGEKQNGQASTGTGRSSSRREAMVVEGASSSSSR